MFRNHDRELTARSMQRIVAAIRRRIGRRLESVLDPEDIAHDCLAQIAASAPEDQEDSGNAGRSLKARILALAELRIRGAARRQVMEVGLDTLSLPPTQQVSEPEQSSRVPEWSAKLHRALRGLRPDHRQIILMRDWYGASWNTVVFALEQPSAHAAQCLYQRARTALGERVQATAACQDQLAF